MTSPNPNTNTSICISTAVGFRDLSISDYATAARTLRPDVIVAVGDVLFGSKPGQRRLDRMVGRTERWAKEMVEACSRGSLDQVGEVIELALFAPILPVSAEQQKWYLDLLADELRPSLSGLAIYEPESALDVPPNLAPLPRLSLAEVRNPHQILKLASTGADIFTVPFVGAATNAGIALSFEFPTSKQSNGSTDRQALGIDMWSTAHARDMTPILGQCKCYACQRHTRAYVQHLLSAREMLAWVLLQMHNIQCLSGFFQQIRASIENETFEHDVQEFERNYEAELPEKTGRGPRLVNNVHYSIISS